MNRKAARCFVILAAALAVAAPVSVLADDSAAAIAAGGLVPRRETRIVMAKEVLSIGLKKVVVDYDFRNDTDEDVITEVAFPIPPYTNEFANGPALEDQFFQSFKLWVDGKPVTYESEATATLNGNDVSAILKANHIDIPTFGHLVVDHKTKQIRVPDYFKLPQRTRSLLQKDGLFDESDDWTGGMWVVHLEYHWMQIFKAHSKTHIRQEYSPVLGFDTVALSSVQDTLTKLSTGHNAYQSVYDDPTGVELLAGFCVDQPVLDTLALSLQESLSRATTAQERRHAGLAHLQWIDFILTSANTWQRPIEDFSLIIERPQPEHGGRALISFCSPANGKVEKLDADHFQVHLTNFVPASELHIGFFEVPLAKLAQPAAKK
jgi:hypothetical protein